MADPKPRFIACDDVSAELRPRRHEAQEGFDETLDRRGGRSLVIRDHRWAGRFLYEARDSGEVRVLAIVNMAADARWLDDDHVVVCNSGCTWVGRIEAGGLVPLAGTDKVYGSIAVLPDGMLAVNLDRGWRLLAWRDGLLRLFAGNLKHAYHTPFVRDDRVLASTVGGDVVELVDWRLADGWDAAEEWRKRVRGLARGKSIPFASVEPVADEPPAEGVRQADGSVWRIHSERAAVLHDGCWRDLAMSRSVAGPHLAELPELEREYRVRHEAHGAVDRDRRVAWLLTANRELVRMELDGGDVELVGSIGTNATGNRTRGLFPLADGRVAIVGDTGFVVISPGGDTLYERITGHGAWGARGCSSAMLLEGDLLVYVTTSADYTKKGIPTSLLNFEQLCASRPRTWQCWELPIYWPTMSVERGKLRLQSGARALEADIGPALTYYRDVWSREDNAPGLPAR